MINYAALIYQHDQKRKLQNRLSCIYGSDQNKNIENDIFFRVQADLQGWKIKTELV
jgi:hypothetical protein